VLAPALPPEVREPERPAPPDPAPAPARRGRALALRLSVPFVLTAAAGGMGYALWPENPSSTPSPIRAPAPSTPAAARPAVDPPTAATPVVRDPSPLAGVPTPADPDSDPGAIERQLEQIRAQARQQVVSLEVAQALATIDRALKLRADDGESRRLREAIVSFQQASVAAGRARQEAFRVGAPKAAPAAFQAGAGLEQDAAADRLQGRLDQATKGLRAARDEYARAVAQTNAAAAEAAASSRVSADPKAPVTSPPGSTAAASAPAADARSGSAPPSGSRGALPGTTAPPAGPPPAPVKPKKRSLFARLFTGSSEEKGVRDALKQYAAAFDVMSVNDLRAVYPSMPEAAVRRLFDDKQSYNLELEVQSIDVADDLASARAVCRVTQSFTTKDGKRQRAVAQTSRFTLVPRGAGWIIAQVQ
jgi:hypothetical protein